MRWISPSPLAGEGGGEGAGGFRWKHGLPGNHTPHPNPLPQGERGQNLRTLMMFLC